MFSHKVPQPVILQEIQIHKSTNKIKLKKTYVLFENVP